jgi:hypothetical protein
VHARVRALASYQVVNADRYGCFRVTSVCTLWKNRILSRANGYRAYFLMKVSLISLLLAGVLWT